MKREKGGFPVGTILLAGLLAAGNICGADSIWIPPATGDAGQAAGGAPAAKPERPWRVSLWGGLTGLDLKEANDEFRLAGAGWEAEFLGYLDYVGSFGFTDSGATIVDSGTAWGFTVARRASSRVFLTAKAGYISTDKLSFWAAGTGVFGEVLYVTEGIKFTLVPVLAGIGLENQLEGGLNYGLSLLAGPLFATGKVSGSYLFEDPFFSIAEYHEFHANLVATAFALEIGGRVGYRITPAWGAFVGADYRVASAKLKAEKDMDIDGDGTVDVAKGEGYPNSRGEVMTFDFKGLEFVGGVQIYF